VIILFRIMARRFRRGIPETVDALFSEYRVRMP